MKDTLIDVAFGLIGPRRRGRPASPWSAPRDPSFVDLPLPGSPSR